MSELLELEMHPFVQNVLQKGVEADKLLLGGRAPVKVAPDYIREPDEHEFFLIRAGISMAEVLVCCQQLEQIPVLLANHRQTTTLSKARINRHSMIVYHLENYFIRTQGLLDRVLKLVDAVFHLLNDPRACRYEVVTRNTKIQVSEVLEPIRGLKKLLDRHAHVRNEIVHERSIKDDALRRLDLFLLIERWERVAPDDKPSNARTHIKESIFEFLRFKKKELLAFNKEIATSMAVILDKLAPYYEREEHALRLRLSKPAGRS